MRRRLAIAAATALTAMVSPAVARQQAVIPAEQGRVEQKQVKRQREAVARGSLYRPVRSRGAQAKPRKVRNRLHVSRRIRRRHRRQA